MRNRWTEFLPGKSRFFSVFRGQRSSALNQAVRKLRRLVKNSKKERTFEKFSKIFFLILFDRRGERGGEEEKEDRLGRSCGAEQETALSFKSLGCLRCRSGSVFWARVSLTGKRQERKRRKQ